MPRGRWPAARVVLVALNGFVAITALGGGLALASGLEGSRFPATWLVGTPFSSYVAPGLILAGLVGGSAVAATFGALRSAELGGRLSLLAGVMLIGWIAGEIGILTADGETVSGTEAGYLTVGAAMLVLGSAITRPRPAAGVS
jgi:hypothetical protein